MDVVMTNVKEKLSKARELLPGMSNDFYLLTDYMSENSNDKLVPIGIVMLASLVLDDLEHCRNGFGGDFPKELADRRNFVKNEVYLIPQLIDAIADEEFATELRNDWEKIFGVVPPKRVDTTTIETSTKYPEYVKVAVDWWTNVIVSPRLSKDEGLPDILSALKVGLAKEYTPEQIEVFKNALSKKIMAVLSINNECTLRVEYQPCSILSEAGKLIGVNSLSFPWKTTMVISPKEVYVIEQYAPKQILWKS